MGNFCDQPSWLIVSSSVSQAFTPSHGTAWPLCATSLAGSRGQPRSWGSPACLVRPQCFLSPLAVCLRMELSPRSFGVSMTPLASATAPAAPCFTVRSLSRSQGWCHLLLHPCPAQAVPPNCGEAGSVVGEHNACLLLPAPLSPQPRDGMAGLVTSRAERAFQFPLCFCT